MPRGHTAFVEKAYIPVFLVGAREVLDKFFELVPTPNETYTTLFWIRETADLDAALRKRQKEERERRRLQRMLGSAKLNSAAPSSQ